MKSKKQNLKKLPEDFLESENKKRINLKESSVPNQKIGLTRYTTLSVEPLISSKKYDPQNPTFFTGAEKTIPFYFVTDTLAFVGGYKGQNSMERKREALKNLFLTFMFHEPSELSSVVLFLSIRLGNDWSKKQTGVGPENLKKIISSVTGQPIDTITKNLKSVGDLGGVLELGLKSVREKSKSSNSDNLALSFNAVFKKLNLLSEIKGTNTQEEKEGLMRSLIEVMSAQEAKFLCRFILGNFGIGAAEKVQLIALSKAFCEFFALKGYQIGDINEKKPEPLCNKSLEIQLDVIDKLNKKATKENITLHEAIPGPKRTPSANEYNFWETSMMKLITECPDHSQIVESLLKLKSLPLVKELCKITPLIPCKPMLAKPTKAVHAIFDNLERKKFTCEFKYDGLRGQVHCTDGKIKIFSRSCDDISETYPDLIEALSSLATKVSSFILDAEIVGWDKTNNKILPFQKLSTRSKKGKNVENEVQVCLFVFDCLYLDEISLLPFSLSARRTKLSFLMGLNSHPSIKPAEYSNCSDVAEIEEFLEESVQRGTEGLMVKLLDNDSSYEPAKRSYRWLKLKKDYIEKEGIGDSLDLVVIGANHGKGKRTGKYGSFLVAAVNPETMEYEACCQVGTGFSDANFLDFKKKFDKLVVSKMPGEYSMENNAMPEVWFKPQVVWEIKAADIQQSPVYLCGKNYTGQRGLGLRFPRFVREREDKNPKDASTSKLIATLYKAQKTVALEDDDDYY